MATVPSTRTLSPAAETGPPLVASVKANWGVVVSQVGVAFPKIPIEESATPLTKTRDPTGNPRTAAVVLKGYPSREMMVSLEPALARRCTAARCR